MTPAQETKISRHISFLLRHDISGVLQIRKDGYVRTGDLVKAVRTKFKEFKKDDLYRIVASDEKQRYSFFDNDLLIRANQGHSIPFVRIEFNQQIPPAILYHGTAAGSLGAILDNGLLPMSRLYVHLSDNFETATEVGKRHAGTFDKVVIFEIPTAPLVEKGHMFYLSENNIWLTENIPVGYLGRVLCKDGFPSA